VTEGSSTIRSQHSPAHLDPSWILISHFLDMGWQKRAGTWQSESRNILSWW